MPAFDDRQRGPRWESRRLRGSASITRAKADDAPVVGGTRVIGTTGALVQNRSMSAAWPIVT
jgi:hypothetical protein